MKQKRIDVYKRQVFIHRVLYALSSGTSHSAQYALAAMLKAANEDKYNVLDEVKVYGERARLLKEIFLRHGFHLVYDNDLGEPVADGFYFTIGYPGMSSGELAKELMYYGVSAISLVTTGSHQEGLRACTSFIQDHQYAQLDERMAVFAENHPVRIDVYKRQDKEKVCTLFRTFLYPYLHCSNHRKFV